MNPTDILKLVDYSTTAVVAGMAFWAIVKVTKLEKGNKNSNGYSKQTAEELHLLNNNHLTTITKSINDSNNRIVDAINSGNKQIIELLGEIKGKLDN